MNKYILRTSLVWIVVLAVLVGIWIYRSHSKSQAMAMNMPMSGDVQRVAAGPSPTTQEPTPSLPEQKKATPIVPVQLTPERMQSIGVKTGTVE